MKEAEDLIRRGLDGDHGTHEERVRRMLAGIGLALVAIAESLESKNLAHELEKERIGL